jgi:hypothetical protein
LELATSGPASLLKLQLRTGEINGLLPAFLPPNVALCHGFRAAACFKPTLGGAGAFAAGEIYFAMAEMM